MNDSITHVAHIVLNCAQHDVSESKMSDIQSKHLPAQSKLARIEVNQSITRVVAGENLDVPPKDMTQFIVTSIDSMERELW